MQDEGPGLYRQWLSGYFVFVSNLDIHTVYIGETGEDGGIEGDRGNNGEGRCREWTWVA